MSYAGYGSLITVRRRTAYLLDRTAAGTTLSWSRQPVRDSVAEVRIVGGTAGTGTVTLAGTSSGAAATETLTTTGPGYYRTAHTWSALVGLTTSGLADEADPPFVEVQAVAGDGSRQETTYTLVSGWPAAVDKGLPEWRATAAGAVFESGLVGFTIPWGETWEPREGDLVDDDLGETWKIIGTPRKASAAFGPEWRCRGRRFEMEP